MGFDESALEFWPGPAPNARLLALASFRKMAATSGGPRTVSRDRRSLFCGARALVFFVLPLAEPYAGAAAVLVDEFHSSALERVHDGGKCRRIAGVAASYLCPALCLIHARRHCR